MNQDLVAAISNTPSDPSAAIERHRMQMESIDLRTLEPTAAGATGGGAAIELPGIETPAPTSAMNMQALAGQFSQGLQHGFYANDMDRLMTKLNLSHQPGSGVTAGDVTVELLNVQAKVGIADAFAKVSTKLSEGLQTMVVKQG